MYVQHMCVHVQEGLRSPGTGVTGGCEPLNVGTGNQTWSSAREASALTSETSPRAHMKSFVSYLHEGWQRPSLTMNSTPWGDFGHAVSTVCRAKEAALGSCTGSLKFTPPVSKDKQVLLVHWEGRTS